MTSNMPAGCRVWQPQHSYDFLEHAVTLRVALVCQSSVSSVSVEPELGYKWSCVGLV